MKLSCLNWSGVHLSKGAATKSPSPKSGHGAKGPGDKVTGPAKAKGRVAADTKSTNRNK